MTVRHGVRLALAAGLGAAAALGAIVGPAAAGYRLVGQRGEETLVANGRVKHVAKGADQPAFVFDVGRGRLWFANPKTRTYWEGTAEEFCTGLRDMMGAAMAGVQEKMKEQMAKMTPEQRAQMEKMLQQRGGAGAPAETTPVRVTVERTGETAPIAGQEARKYRVLADGRPYEDVWIATDAALLKELNVARLPETYGRLSACRGAAEAPGGPRPRVSVAQSAEYRQLYAAGWPVKIVHYDPDGAARPQTELVSLERRDIPEAEFAPPAGFTKVPLAEAFGVGRR